MSTITGRQDSGSKASYHSDVRDAIQGDFEIPYRGVSISKRSRFPSSPKILMMPSGLMCLIWYCIGAVPVPSKEDSPRILTVIFSSWRVYAMIRDTIKNNSI